MVIPRYLKEFTILNGKEESVSNWALGLIGNITLLEKFILYPEIFPNLSRIDIMVGTDCEGLEM